MSQTIVITAVAPEYQTHKLTVKGKSGAMYQVTILENSRATMSDCTCGKHKCFHVVQILAGVQDILASYEDVETQQRIMESLKTTPAGRSKIAKSTRLAGLEESCPVCNSNKVKRPRSFSLRSALFGSSKKAELQCNHCNYRW